MSAGSILAACLIILGLAVIFMSDSPDLCYEVIDSKPTVLKEVECS